jgi:hypothetical protein
MRRGWRVLRQHGLRGRSGQVSAVATVLALMLFTSFLATFVLGQLPAQMSAQEFQHQLQVEDQFAGLQNDLLQAAGAWQPSSVGLTSLVLWNHGNLCTTITATSCTSSGVNGHCTPPLSYNLSVNGTAYLFDLTGNSDCTILNITGSHDTITLEVTGSTIPYLLVTLFGTNDTILLNNQFSASNFHASFYLYGAYDNYTSSGGPTGSTIYLNTYFIGETPSAQNCPSDNLAATDRYSISGASSSHSIQNFTWYNLNGYSTSYHTTSGWPGSGNSGSSVLTGWQNVSAPVSCAFASYVVGEPTSVYLSSPVTLNSGSVPPFGVPSSGALQIESSRVSTQVAFAVSNLSAANIHWNSGSACFAATAPGSGTCTSGTGLEVYNFSGNSTTVSPTVAGCAVAGCTVIYNVSGNSNTLSLTLSGANIGRILYQVHGNLNTLTLTDGGTCNIHQTIVVNIFGNNDTYALDMTGCTTGAGAAINTLFVGSDGTICPYGNAANYDTLSSVTWGAATGINQNLTWQNAYGIISPPHKISGTSGTNNYLTFANTTGYAQCLFTKAITSGPYTLDFNSGIKAVLNNRYIEPSTVAYDQGAVILGVENGGSVMVSAPDATYIQDPSGVLFSLQLFNVAGSTATSTGYGTAAVISHILSVQTYQINNGRGSPDYIPYFYLNITTPYPQAWATYWAKQGPVDPTGTTCVPGAGVSAADCLTPPLGDLSTIVVPINANQFVLTSVVAQLSVY